MEHFLSQGELFFKTWMSFLKREFFFKVECFFTRWFSSRGSRGARLPLSSLCGHAFVRRAGDKYRLIFAGKRLRQRNIIWYLLENGWGGKLVIMKKVVFLHFGASTKWTKAFFCILGLRLNEQRHFFCILELRLNEQRHLFAFWVFD